MGPLRALTKGPGSLNTCQPAMVHRGKDSLHGSNFRHSPPGNQKNFKGIRRTGKARYGWQRPKIPAVKKLRHEDFKSEASLYNLQTQGQQGYNRETLHSKC